MKSQIYIGTSGWHYPDWIGTFYPKDIKGYNELKYLSQHFNTVENNSSFYRIAKESTYKTWSRMTPDNFKFSMKLNKLITHINRLKLTDEVQERVKYILDSTQVLENKLGVIVIQLPASFKFDLEKLVEFLKFYTSEINKHKYKFKVAIEFRNKYWFVDEVFDVLKKYNIALITGQSSRYPEVRHVTADFAYIRMHGPGKLFASRYSIEQLKDMADYIKNISPKVKQVYIFFNNDYYGYAIENAKELMDLML